MWDVHSLDFDETATSGWWRKPAAVDKPAWGEDEPLHFDHVEDPTVDPPVEEPGAIVPVPPAVDDDDGEGPGADVPDGGGGGGLLDDVDDDDPPAMEGAPARMSQRERRGVPPLRLIETMMAADESDNGGAPATYQEALLGLEGKEWQKAFDAEVKSLNENKVYTVVDRPVAKKVVKAKWVLRRKLLPGGKLDKLKARIVAKGFTQREGIDYEETFSPTVRFESVRLMVAAAAVGKMHTHQMDVVRMLDMTEIDKHQHKH